MAYQSSMYVTTEVLCCKGQLQIGATLVPDWCQTSFVLMPDQLRVSARPALDWYQTRSRFVTDQLQIGVRPVQDWCYTSSRSVPDQLHWCLASFRLVPDQGLTILDVCENVNTQRFFVARVSSRLVLDQLQIGATPRASKMHGHADACRRKIF